MSLNETVATSFIKGSQRDGRKIQFPNLTLTLCPHQDHVETGDTYVTHSMLLSWAVTSSLPVSSRFQRISEERNRTWPDGSGSFMCRQIVSAPRAFTINAQFMSVFAKWNAIIVRGDKTTHWPADIDTRTLKILVLIVGLIVIWL